MTYEEASRLITMLTYNFAAFMPAEPPAAAYKKGMWAEELMKYDFVRGQKAVKTMIQALQFPPTIYDLRQALGVGGEMTRDDYTARLPGPTYDSEEGAKALYTADMGRVDRLMADLDKELARMPDTFDRRVK